MIPWADLQHHGCYSSQVFYFEFWPVAWHILHAWLLLNHVYFLRKALIFFIKETAAIKTSMVAGALEKHPVFSIFFLFSLSFSLSLFKSQCYEYINQVLCTICYFVLEIFSLASLIVVNIQKCLFLRWENSLVLKCANCSH